MKRSWIYYMVLLSVAVTGCVFQGYRVPVSAGTRKVEIIADASRSSGVLDHAWEYMSGSGNASLYIRPVWKDKLLDHLVDVRENLGVRTVRFHGIFIDGVGVYQGPGKYDFENVDKIYDSILAAKVKPFIELSFMPEKLASCQTRTFRGGYAPFVCPPRDYEEWGNMVRAFAGHLLDRYGADEVRTWSFEVWNEPNLRGFYDGSKQDYFKLYEVTAKAIKSADPALQVGGPATCSAQPLWIWDLKKFCESKGLPLDFVSTHGYSNEFVLMAQMESLKAGLAPVSAPGQGHFHNLLKLVRTVTDKAPFAKVPLYITEWNSSIAYGYGKNVAVNDHDLPNDAAFMCDACKQANGFTEGFSHWTYSDVFEEMGLPTVNPLYGAFHGGFGLITIDGIHKPAYHALKFMHRMGRNLLAVESKDAGSGLDSLITLDGRALNIIAWNYLDTVKKKQYSGPTAEVAVRVVNLPEEMKGKKIKGYRIDWDHGNPFAGWVEMGKPYALTPGQAEELKKQSDQTLRDAALEAVISGPELKMSFKLPPAGVVFLTTE